MKVEGTKQLAEAGKTRFENTLIILPDRPHSEQLTISSGLPVFLFKVESPRQKSQNLEFSGFPPLGLS